MATTVFEVNKALDMTGSGSLTHAMHFVGKNVLANTITKSIEAFRLIDKEYRKAMSNDGKIVGTERTDILDRIDLLLNMMILVWQNLETTSEESHICIENKEHNFTMEFFVNKVLWKAQGHLTPNMNRPVKNFHEIYSSKLAPQVISLLQTYKEACEDHIIDDDERASLRKGIKQVLYYVIFLRFQLEKCFINA
ncbi:MAG: hypothetical protein GY754_18465 [bacterium]|nr:hypothetical protein [bacterium]